MALVASLTRIDKLAFLWNIGTRFGFFLVCLGVLVLRVTRPTLPRPCRCPAGKLTAPDWFALRKIFSDGMHDPVWGMRPYSQK